MNQALDNLLQSSTGSLSIQEILMNFLLSLILGIIIFVSYRFTHSGAVYSPRFNASLLMLTIITALVMNVIGNNIALSLGMVGALSIVRFRTAIKDSRDTIYIFWCIAVGICCGVSEYLVPSVGSGIIFLITLLFGAVQANNRYLLIIHCASEAGEEIEHTILTSYAGRAALRVKNTTQSSCEYIYELSQSLVNQARSKGKSIQSLLYGIQGVQQVNLVMQSEEINQ